MATAVTKYPHQSRRAPFRFRVVEEPYATARPGRLSPTHDPCSSNWLRRWTPKSGHCNRRPQNRLDEVAGLRRARGARRALDARAVRGTRAEDRPTRYAGAQRGVRAGSICPPCTCPVGKRGSTRRCVGCGKPWSGAGRSCSIPCGRAARGWLRAEGRRPRGGDMSIFSARVRMLYADATCSAYSVSQQYSRGFEDHCDCGLELFAKS